MKMETMMPPKMNTMFILAYPPISRKAYRGVSAAMAFQAFVYNAAAVVPWGFSMPLVPMISAGISAAMARKI